MSVVVPTFRDWAKLLSCLKCLSVQTYPRDRFEILVVDNDPGHSHSNSGLEAFRNVRILSEREPGSYAARNHGISQAKGEILGFTDADCFPDEDWIERAVEELLAYPDFTRIGGAIRVVTSGGQRLNLAENYERFLAFPQADYVQRHGACATANMFAWRRVFESIGGFNTGSYSGSDIEWGGKAQAAGFRIRYSSRVVVSHPARREYSQLMAKARRVGGGMYKRRPLPFLLAHAAMVVAIMPPLGKMLKVFRQKGSNWDKVRAFLVHYHLRLIQTWARLRVAYGAVSPRH